MKQLILILLFINCININAQNWRSVLYPEDWKPGYADNEGRFIHDFSYAGYRYGQPIPDINHNIVDVTGSPYFADNTGNKDATSAIQKAIDDVGRQGGGIVYLPEGEYALSVDSTKNYGLILHRDNVVLRGAGAEKTFLKNTTSSFRTKQVIYVIGFKSSWRNKTEKMISITKDIQTNTFEIPVEDVTSFKVGDLIIIGTNLTKDFIETHGMTGYWTSKITGQRYCRYVTAIDKKKRTLRIDIPTRYKMLMSDSTFVYKVGNHVKEVGLEGFSIGNIENSRTEGWNTNVTAGGADDLAFMRKETGAYQVHYTHFIVFRNAVNCWARNINTYKPKENCQNIHILSNALLLVESRSVTVDNCNFSCPQYRGGGGNGYMFTLAGSDCLISNSKAKGARHNYAFKSMYTHGNVIYNCIGSDSRYSTDFHMHLSMANLLDNFTSDGDYIEAKFRSGGGISGFMHGQVTTESVFWNTKGVKAHFDKDFLIDSRQYGWGYVIGTSGAMDKVVTTPISETENQWGTDLISDIPELRERHAASPLTQNNSVSYNTAPEDFVEGVGRGETLVPQSLYMDQLARRQARIKK